MVSSITLDPYSIKISPEFASLAMVNFRYPLRPTELLQASRGVVPNPVALAAYTSSHIGRYIIQVGATIRQGIKGMVQMCQSSHCQPTSVCVKQARPSRPVRAAKSPKRQPSE